MLRVFSIHGGYGHECDQFVGRGSCTATDDGSVALAAQPASQALDSGTRRRQPAVRGAAKLLLSAGHRTPGTEGSRQRQAFSSPPEETVRTDDEPKARRASSPARPFASFRFGMDLRWCRRYHHLRWLAQARPLHGPRPGAPRTNDLWLVGSGSSGCSCHREHDTVRAGQ